MMKMGLIVFLSIAICAKVGAVNTTQDLYIAALEAHFRFELDTLKTGNCKCVSEDITEYISEDSLTAHHIKIISSESIKRKPISLARVIPVKISGDTVSITVVQYGVSYHSHTYSHTRTEATKCSFVFSCEAGMWAALNVIHTD